MQKFIVTIDDTADIDAVASRLDQAGARVLQKLIAIGVINVEFGGDAARLKVEGVEAIAPDAKMRAI